MAVRTLKKSSIKVDEKYTSFLAGNPVFGEYESIATVTLAANQASLSFSSIPATYTHLQIRGNFRDIRAVNGNDLAMRFNSDAATNYSYHLLSTNSATVISASATSTASMLIAKETAGSDLAGNFAAVIVDILDYANTNKFKTIKTLSGYDNNNLGTPTGSLGLYSGNWRSTAAVNAISFVNSGPFNWAAGTRVSLYGIRS